MEQATHSVLASWQNFYVIIGPAVAALIGLQFVSIVLSAGTNLRSADAHHTFTTPTIVHFCTVLFISAIMSAPWPALWHVALVVALCGLAGVIYMIIIIRAVRQQKAYELVLEDWVVHFTLPPIAYATLLIAALLLPGSPVLAMFVGNGAILLLLFVGIHNAWDIVTFIAINARQAEEEEEQK